MILDALDLAGGVVVTGHVHIEIGGELFVDLCEELPEPPRGAGGAAIRRPCRWPGPKRRKGWWWCRAPVVVAGPFRNTGRHGRTGWDRFIAWICDFFVYAHHQGPFGRIQIQPDHAVDLSTKKGSVDGSNDSARLRGQAEGPPVGGHRRLRHSGPGRLRPGRPVRSVLRLALQGNPHQLDNLLFGHRADRTRLRGVVQPVEPIGEEPATSSGFASKPDGMECGRGSSGPSVHRLVPSRHITPEPRHWPSDRLRSRRCLFNRSSSVSIFSMESV